MGEMVFSSAVYRLARPGKPLEAAHLNTQACHAPCNTLHLQRVIRDVLRHEEPSLGTKSCLQAECLKPALMAATSCRHSAVSLEAQLPCALEQVKCSGAVG